MQADLNARFVTGDRVFFEGTWTKNTEGVTEMPCLIEDARPLPGEGCKTLPAIMNYIPTNECELIDIDDISTDILDSIGETTGAEQAEDPDVPVNEPGSADISAPREVTVGVSEEQKTAVNELVDSVVNHFEGSEVLDNVMYKDENGNPKSQVVTKKNDDGTYSKITITYDKSGNVKHAAAIKYMDQNMSSPLDGYEITFQYNDDGTITAQPNYGWDVGNGYKMNIAVYLYPITIEQDGSADFPLGILQK